MPCGGCGKKKKVEKRMPSESVSQSQYRNSVMNTFMASRNKIVKNKQTGD